MTHPSHDESSGSRSSRTVWLLLLLVILILALVIYDQGAAKKYSQKAYSTVVSVSQRISGMARSLYNCGLQGCPATTDKVATAPAGSGNMAASSQNAYPVPAEPATSSLASSEQATTPADTPSTMAPAPVPDGQMQGAEGDGQTYPAYPSGPADLPPGNLGSSQDSMPSSEPASEMPPSAPGPMMASPQPMQLPYLPPTIPPPMPSMPVAPEYPEFPQHQSFMPPPPMMQPPPMTAPQATNSMPDNSRMNPTNAPDGGKLTMARQAAQAGNLHESVREYLYFLTSHPNDIDAFGELGNVYLKMGRYQEAAQNYYEAATRLIDAGYPEIAAPMMPVIQAHEPMLASLLNKKMANASAGNQDYRR